MTVQGWRRVVVRDDKGKPGTARVEVSYRRMTVRPPIGKGSPAVVHRQAGMHQQPAGTVCMRSRPALSLPLLIRFGHAYDLRATALPGERRPCHGAPRSDRRWPRRISSSLTRSLEKKTIGRLRAGPVLGGQRKCSLRTRLPCARPVGEGGYSNDHQRADMSQVLRQTTVPPSSAPFPAIRCQTRNLVRFRQTQQLVAPVGQNIKMWVIDSLAGGLPLVDLPGA